jgi:hypothetical protein
VQCLPQIKTKRNKAKHAETTNQNSIYFSTFEGWAAAAAAAAAGQVLKAKRVV